MATATANDINISLLASASAPGKLILFGEHAVVYGQPAIAACLSDLRIRVDVSTNENDDIIAVDLPDLKPDPLCIEIPCHALMALSKSDGSDNGASNITSSDSASNSIDLHSALVQRGPPTPDDANKIRKMLTNLKKSNSIDVDLSELHLSALVPLIYLMNTLKVLEAAKNDDNKKINDNVNGHQTKRPRPRGRWRGLSIVVKSENLPLGAGLGSSAAFSVAASAALYKVVLSFRGVSNDNNNRNDDGKVVLVQPAKDQLDVINTLAFYSETLIHGTPSGIDNTVSCYGGALQYIKSKYGNTNSDKDAAQEKEEEGGTTFIENFPPLNVILTNTNVPRSTKILVQGVRDWREEYPAIADPILDSIGRIGRTFCKNVLQQVENQQQSQSTSTKTSLSVSQSKQISKLIQMNHSLLCALGVSHPSLNAITNLTSNLYNEFKCSTKLTGAGGGGCAFTFFEQCDNDDDNVGGSNSGLSVSVSMEERLKIVSHKIEALKSCEGTEGMKVNSNGSTIGEGGESSSLWSFQCFSSAVGGKGVLWL